MSTKVWALNRETGEILNVNNIDKSFKGKMVCLDENCGEELIICMGEKNKPYFSHQKNTKCTGGSTESVLTQLSKQVLRTCTSFYIPEESTIFRGKKVVMSPSRTISVAQVQLNCALDEKFKATAKLTSTENEVFFVEFGTKDMSTSRRKAYARFGCRVIMVDLHQFARDVDSVKEDELKEFICGDKGIKTYVTSPFLAFVEDEIQKSLFCGNGDYLACPARDFEAIVEKKRCKECPFYMHTSRTDGAIYCAGKGCYSDASDFKADESFENRYDRYIDLVPSPVWGVDKFAYTNVIGTCPRCGGSLEVAQGTRARRIVGIRSANKDTAYAYRVCEDCGGISLIKCPACGDPMELKINRKTGGVFLGCTGYRATGGCRASITLYTCEPCRDNFADQLLQVDSLDFFLNNYRKAMKILFNKKG